MAGELETTPPSAPLATDAGATSQPATTAQPQSGDDRLAAIRAKQQAGEPLTASERGYLGSVRRKAKPRQPAAAPAQNILLDVQPELPSNPPPGDNPLFEADEGTALSAGDLDDALFSEERCRRAAEAILDGVDLGGKIGVGFACDSAKLPRSVTASYESAVAIQPRNRQLMVGGSVPIIRAACRWFKCSPEKLPEILQKSEFFLGAGCHALAVFAVFRSIRESGREQQQQTRQTETKQ